MTKNFKEALENTFRNLPEVLFNWHRYDSTLKAHYADELARLLCEAIEAQNLMEEALRTPGWLGVHRLAQENERLNRENAMLKELINNVSAVTVQP